MKIVFVINALSVGGAEKMLLRLIESPKFQEQQVAVIALLPNGSLFDDFARVTKVYAFKFGSPLGALLGFIQLFFLIKRMKPDVVHSWLYQSDLIAGLIAKILGVKVIVWSIRQSNLERKYNKSRTLLAAKLCGLFSNILPDLIISNSIAGTVSHVKFKYQKSKIKVIPNGIDLRQFSLGHGKNRLLQHEIGKGEDISLIGMFARVDPQKDHSTFLRSAAIVLEQNPKVHFVLCGRGADYSNKTLTNEINILGLQKNVTLLGMRSDIEKIASSLDIHVLCSSGEGWPNVIGEMMAAGVLCVSTDVGESRSIMGKVGVTVPVGDEKQISKAVARFLSLSQSEKQKLRLMGRSRIEKKYDISKVSEEYFYHYNHCLEKNWKH